MFDGSSHGESLDGCCSDTVHACVEFEMHCVGCRRGLLRGTGNRIGELNAVDRWCQLIPDNVIRVRERGLREDEDWHVDVGLPQADALFNEGHGEPRGTAANCGLRDRYIPMSVSVSLHDRTQLRRADCREELLHVVLDSVKIDFNP